MRITESQLRNVIKKELRSVLSEAGAYEQSSTDADNYFYSVYEYLKRQKDGKAPAANFTYKPEEAKAKGIDAGPHTDNYKLKTALLYSQRPLGGGLEGYHCYTLYLDNSGKLVDSRNTAQHAKQIDIVRLPGSKIGFYERPVKK